MDITLHEITIRELVEGYKDCLEEGVVGFGGKLDIRPPYQREFIYKDKQRDAVINTILSKFPLNTMYWATKKNGNYEIIDGQQRTVSICKYVTKEFSVDNLKFYNQPDDIQKQILNYRLMIYFCSGEDSEKLDWFRTINIAGEKLNDQELHNAVYAGSWTHEAKKYFSKKDCAAHGIAKDYMTGSTIRQDYLETAIDWITTDDKDKNDRICKYMSGHQDDPNANDLWLYFKGVIDWVKVTFVKPRREMKGVNFGLLHKGFKDILLDSNKLEEEIVELMQDDDVTKKSGIYTYVLTGEEKYLNVRSFTENQKREAYEREEGICPKCGKYFELEEMEADHMTPWSKGGKTIPENCQMLCPDCNRHKTNL